MNNLSQRTRIFILVLIILVIVVGFGWLLLHKSVNNKAAHYEKDPLTGRQVFVDPNQASEGDSYPSFMTLQNAEKLASDVTDSQFEDIRQSIEDYVHKNVGSKINYAAVENGKITEGGVERRYTYDFVVVFSDSSVKLNVHVQTDLDNSARTTITKQ